MSPAPSSRSCASSALGTLSRSRRPLASSGLPSVRHMPRRSSASRAGWSRCSKRLGRSASPPRSSTRGFFRTELLEPASVTYAEPSIEDYADRTAEQLKWWQAQSGQQGGDPAKLARALVTIASEAQPPRRFIAGADAIATAEQKIADLQAQIDAYRDLSTSLAFEELEPVGSAR